MKRKIVLSLLILFLISGSGAVLSTMFISDTTSTLSRLVKLHQIEDLRQHLIISIQAVQSELYTVHTMLGHKVDTIVDNVTKLDQAAAACGGCHHEPAIAKDLAAMQDMVRNYQEALSYYITASANKQRIDRLKLDTATMGNDILSKTENMTVQAAKKLETTTALAMARIRDARLILILTMIVTVGLGIVVAAHLTRSITRPIDIMVTATRAITDGKLGETITLDDKTEFGELASHFNAMSLAMKENYGELLREIAERRQTEEALRESEERYALAAAGANDGLWDWNIRNNTVHYSFRWKSMLGFDDAEIGDTLDEWLSRVHPDDREQVEAKLSAHINSQSPQFECEHRVRHQDGAYRWMLNRGLAVRDEHKKAYRMAGSQTDITARKSAEAQLLYDAFHDALTGLPNRALFMDRLAHVIASRKRHTEDLYGVLFMDLDRFKVINDSLGHSVGDKLLIEVGKRLKACLRPGDTVARLGGDEFAILLENITDASDAEEITRRIEQALTASYTIQGNEIVTGQSIGIALRSERYEWPEQILRDADIAMYEAKSKGRARHEFFDTNMHASIIDRLQLEADLRIAVEHREGFVLHYQPIIDLKDRHLVGFEALVRWKHRTRGLVAPLEFIPLAEETGLIVPLSDWILREACGQIRLWQQQYPAQPGLRMSVNISSRQLLQAGFADSVAEIVSIAGIDPGSLAIEVTESMIMEHTSVALDTMARLQNMGVRIHIDDFGTGYSSLSYLHSFPVNALKIDRSFIARMTADNENQEIVRTIIALAQNLKLDVIAEGVELDHQLETIKGLDCQYGQGFLFSRPLPAEAMDAWIRSEKVAAV
jgi:diguanylate cyclase (GGDEF)-like protein/PAS domain S-box-containing protein